MKSTAHPRVIERGILTSAYKQEIRKSTRLMKRKTISDIKDAFLSSHHNSISETGTILKVSFFTLILVIVLL